MSRSAPRTVPALVALALVLAACFGTASSPDSSVEATADPTSSATASASASPAPTDEPTATPSEAASAAPSFDAGGELTVAPNPEADSLFLERDTCLNRQDGYQLEFPEDWYTNTEIRDVPACSWFSPEFYEVDDFAEIPDEIAIEIFWVDGDRGYVTEILSREDVMVSTQAAVRLEVEGTADGSSDGRSYEYVIRLGPTPEQGPNLVARTDTSMGGDYELNKAVLDRMMATIEFVGTTQ